jgi:hypothetical protein
VIHDEILSGAEDVGEKSMLALNLINDAILRGISAQLNEDGARYTVPLCRADLPQLLNSTPRDGRSCVIRVAVKAFPVPDEQCSSQDILDFKSEAHDKQWTFRRFLHSLATKPQSAAEIRDDIEWTVNEYSKAMEVNRLKTARSFVDVFVMSPLEVIENLIKINWSKVARGLLSVEKRKVELLEAELKAPGRECAYVFDARKRFGAK